MLMAPCSPKRDNPDNKECRERGRPATKTLRNSGFTTGICFTILLVGFFFPAGGLAPGLALNHLESRR